MRHLRSTELTLIVQLKYPMRDIRLGSSADFARVIHDVR
jgi:hypothetical protein